MWSEFHCYLNARDALQSALAEDQILAGIEDLSGIHVMTIHKSKGKQFDGVIILREGRRTGARSWASSFVWRDDKPPYLRSRKILRVAITRARKHVLFLNPVYRTVLFSRLTSEAMPRDGSQIRSFSNPRFGL
jgi:DNA helicase-2/ATP-dependent DNA helicase PcrA